MNPYPLDHIHRATLRQAVDDDAFGDATDALRDAGLARAAVCILLDAGVCVSTIDAWRRGMYAPNARAWKALRSASTEAGWARVVKVRAAWSDLRRRGTGRRKAWRSTTTKEEA